MIHDSLLSCLNLYIKRLPIEEFVLSDAVSTFLHPGEKKILEDIIKTINLHRDIAKFTKLYSANYNLPSNALIVDSDEPLQSGLYLKAFANGVDIVLQDYLEEITVLEQRFLQNPCQSLLFIYQKLNVFEPLLLYLKKLIRGIRSQRLHGCAIIQYLHQNMQHGDNRILNAMKLILSTVNIVFLKQLTHWILYGKIVDSYGEFFIQCAEFRNNSTVESDKGISGSGRNTITSISDGASTYAEIWRYEISYELLPHYLSSSWAEKVLFIGQTVLIFKADAEKISKNVQIWTKTEKSSIAVGALWNENEHLYFEMIQALHRDAIINISQYERVIDEIKLYVTTRLSEIAINQADLVKQLKLIKDFYLLGRGELYLEFIRSTYKLGKDIMNENKIRDLVKAFESAAHAVGVSEDLDQFSLSIPKSNMESDGQNGLGYIHHVQLLYKINWPLHLLFSPKVIERYNTLFRFLLLLKKMQYELHMIWCSHTRENKMVGAQNITVISLRNQLMFFVDNLQYYIQVDVLESQFSILINTILNKADFEQIQRSHSVFQANILSLCFLLADFFTYVKAKDPIFLFKEDAKKTGVTQSSILLSSNPVYVVLTDIFHVCEEFCEIIDSKSNPNEEIEIVSTLNKRFGKLIEQLTSLLVRLKSAPSFTPLSQLLLHLDFNHWFSSQRGKKNEEDE